MIACCGTSSKLCHVHGLQHPKAFACTARSPPADCLEALTPPLRVCNESMNEAASDLMGYKLFMLSRWALMAALMVSGTSSRMSAMSSALLLSSAHAHIRLSTFADVTAAHASNICHLGQRWYMDCSSMFSRELVNWHGRCKLAVCVAKQLNMLDQRLQWHGLGSSLQSVLHSSSACLISGSKLTWCVSTIVCGRLLSRTGSLISWRQNREHRVAANTISIVVKPQLCLQIMWQLF